MKCIIIINCSFVNVRQWDKDKMDHRIYTIFWKCFLLYNVIEHYSAWVFSCKSAVYFPKNTSGGLLLTEWSLNQKISGFFIFSSALYAIEGLQCLRTIDLIFRRQKMFFVDKASLLSLLVTNTFWDVVTDYFYVVFMAVSTSMTFHVPKPRVIYSEWVFS